MYRNISVYIVSCKTNLTIFVDTNYRSEPANDFLCTIYSQQMNIDIDTLRFQNLIYINKRANSSRMHGNNEIANKE